TRRRRRTYLFCVYGSGIRPDLHSFPTRRSSDLLPRTSSKCASMSRCNSIVLRRVLYSKTLPVTAEILSARSDTLTTLRLVCAWRSEEHTSELQSRENLVCRLLPEKKKDAIQRHA